MPGEISKQLVHSSQLWPGSVANRSLPNTWPMVLLCQVKIRELWEEEGCQLVTCASWTLWKGLQWKEPSRLCTANVWFLAGSFWAVVMDQQRTGSQWALPRQQGQRGNQPVTSVPLAHCSTPLCSFALEPCRAGLCTCATLAQQHPDPTCSPHLAVAMTNQSLSSSVKIIKHREESKNALMLELDNLLSSNSKALERI